MENITQHVIELENQYWQSLADKDTDTSLRLTADPCLLTGAQGAAAIDHATFRRMSEGTSWELHDFSLADVHVELPAPDVAVIAYTVTEKMTVEGKALTLKAADASTWVRNGDGWRCVLHTESILGDPFGRDKAEAKPAKKPAAKKAASKKPARSMRRNASSRRPKAKR
jgi:hypothetical protein